MRLKVLFLLGALVLSRFSAAGFYEIHYSGGTVEGVGPTGLTWTGGFAPNGNGYYGGSAKSSDTETSSPGMGTARATGSPITVTLVWNNLGNAADLPPDFVILKETSNAIWSGSVGYSDNGLGHDHLYDEPGHGHSSGSKIQVITNPGYSSFYTRNMHSSADLGAINPGNLLSASASVSYRAQVWNLEMEVYGTKKLGGMDQIMIGQKARAHLIPTGNIQIVSQAWTIGGGIFSSYEADKYKAQVLTNIALSSPQPAWFWRVNGDFLVKCSVMFEVEGTPYGPTILEQKVRVRAPQISILPFVGPAMIYSYKVQAGEDEYNAGMHLVGRATTPVDFVSGSDYGQVYWAQLCNLDRWQRYSFGTQTKETKTNGFVNDNKWPSEGPGSAASALEFQDSPFVGFNIGMTAIKIDDHFKTYLLYKPPGADSQIVPLWRVDWKWTVPLTGWPFITPIPGMEVAIENSTRQYTHPVWNAVYINNEGVQTGSGSGTEP